MAIRWASLSLVLSVPASTWLKISLQTIDVFGLANGDLCTPLSLQPLLLFICRTTGLTAALHDNVRKRNDIKDFDKPEAAARFAIGFLCAGFGFLTGIMIWFAMPSAFGISFSLFFWLSVTLAAIFSFTGFFNPVFASQMLGNIWDTLGVINRKIFFWIRLIK